MLLAVKEEKVADSTDSGKDLSYPASRLLCGYCFCSELVVQCTTSFRTVTKVSREMLAPRDTDIAVFNFFEPLHYFQHNEGFQTWELSPQFAIRSWSYVLLHWPLAGAIPRLLSLGKVSFASMIVRDRADDCRDSNSLRSECFWVSSRLSARRNFTELSSILSMRESDGIYSL